MTVTLVGGTPLEFTPRTLLERFEETARSGKLTIECLVALTEEITSVHKLREWAPVFEAVGTHMGCAWLYKDPVEVLRRVKMGRAAAAVASAVPGPSKK